MVRWLVVLAVVGTALYYALWGIRTQKRATAELEGLSQETVIETKPGQLRWFDKVLKTTPPDDVASVSFGGFEIGDQELACLKTFHRLELLDLEHSGIRDEHLATVATLHRLRGLYLGHTSITDAGLEHLADLTNLTLLSLDFTGVTDEGLKHLRGLANLEHLSLDGTAVSDAGLRHLKGMKLKLLAIGSTRVTETGVREMRQAYPKITVLRGQAHY